MIKKLKQENFEEFLILLKEYHDFYKVRVPLEKARKYFMELIEKPQDGQVFLAVSNTQAILGFSTVYFFRNSLICEVSGYLHDLYVKPEARGLGLAKTLVKASADHVQNKGYPEMYWHTHLSNKAAQGLYDSLTPYKSQWISYGMKLSP